MRTIWQSEVDEFCSRVLAKHWPDVPNLGDVTSIDWSEVERPDLICGGYPCQPFSLAGGRRGTEDARHLWPYFAQSIRVLRPRWALLENVPGHLSLGFGDVLGDLAELGYDAEWECLPAAAFGAPHLRYRVVVVAYTDDGGGRKEQVSVLGSCDSPLFGDDGASRSVADAESSGRDERRDGDDSSSWEIPIKTGGSGRLLPNAASDPRRVGNGNGRADGSHWEVEPSVGRVADGVPDRVDRLRSLGNAVVPQMAEWVGRRILEAA